MAPLITIVLLFVMIGASPQCLAQSGFRIYNTNGSLLVFGAPAMSTNVDISIRPAFANGLRMRNSFTVGIDGTARVFDNVRDISIWSGGGRNNVSVEDVYLEGSLDIQLSNSRDYVAVSRSIVEGDIRLLMGDGYNRLSLGDTMVFGSLFYDGGLGPDSLNEPYSGGTTSQADCTIFGDLNYVDLGGDDWVELNRFNIGGSLLVAFGRGDDTLRVTSSDSGVGFPVYGGVTSIGGDSVIVHYGQEVAVTVEDTKIDGSFNLFSNGESSRVFLRSRRTGNRWSPMSVEAGVFFFSDGQRSRTEVSGLSSGVFQLMSEAGEDGVHVTNSELSRVHIELGRGKDAVSVANTTVKQSMFLDGGSGDNDSGDVVQTEAQKIINRNFEAGNLSP